MANSWPPPPSTPRHESVPRKSTGPESVFSFIVAALLGAGVYFATLYFMTHNHFAVVVMPIGRIGFLATVLLCNFLPCGIFLRLRQSWFYEAWCFLSGSMFLSLLIFLFTLRVWFLPA
jgi:hypothetical protein